MLNGLVINVRYFHSRYWLFSMFRRMHRFLACCSFRLLLFVFGADFLTCVPNLRPRIMALRIVRSGRVRREYRKDGGGISWRTRGVGSSVDRSKPTGVRRYLTGWSGRGIHLSPLSDFASNGSSAKSTFGDWEGAIFLGATLLSMDPGAVFRGWWNRLPFHFRVPSLVG